MRLPFRDFRPGETADTSSSYDSHPAAMAERQRMDTFCVLSHIHFEDVEDDLWPTSEFAAHSTQSTLAALIQTPMNLMHWSFDFP